MPQALIETEETLIIETPERVSLEFALASIGNRFFAVTIDHILQFISIIIVVWVFSAISGFGGMETFDALTAEMSKGVVALMIFIIFLLFSGYFVFFEWILNGQTPGKKLLKLRVIREDGRPITLWEALTRNLLRIFDALPGVVIPIYSIGLITIFFNRRDQRIGDIFAGTVVIRERMDEAPTFEETFSKTIGDSAIKRVQKRFEFQADVYKLSVEEIEVVEIFLRRRWDLNEKQRLWMAWRIALPIMFKLKPKYDLEDFSYEGFLEELLHRVNLQRRF
jgi:uncharacterized RDD family membrane protein YckC